MARPLRIEKVGGWHHVTARGNGLKKPSSVTTLIGGISWKSWPKWSCKIKIGKSNGVGLSPAPKEEQVRERMRVLRGYRWSACR